MPIEQVKHAAYLGVVFYDNVDWSYHISYINTKIATGVGIICRTNNTSALIHLYNAFVFPYLFVAWGM